MPEIVPEKRNGMGIYVGGNYARRLITVNYSFILSFCMLRGKYVNTSGQSPASPLVETVINFV
jgi:hypothetical protein